MWDEEARFGPKRRFNQYHIWKSLYSLSRRKFGRKKLAEVVGVGEGSVRSIVSILSEHELIVIKQSGMFITPEGRRHLEELALTSHSVDVGPLCPGSVKFAFLVKGKASKVGDGLKLRDTAVKHGASGLTTIILRKGKLFVPPEFCVDDEYPEISQKLRKLFPDMRARDVILLAGGETFNAAEEGGFFAALSLINSGRA